MPFSADHAVAHGRDTLATGMSRYSVGLDNSAALDLIAGDAGNASVVAAHNARKDARERAGNNINLSLQKLEKVRFLFFVLR